MQRLFNVAKCIHVDFLKKSAVMDNEIKGLRARMLADRIVLESLIKNLHDAKVIDGRLVINDLKKLISEPINIGTDPVKNANYKYELTDWHDVLLHIL